MIWCAAAGLATAFAWWVGRPDDRLLLAVRMNLCPSVDLVRLPPVTLVIPAAGLAIAVIPSTVSQVAASAVAAAVAFGFGLHRRAIRSRLAREFRAETGTFLRAWSGELRSGLAPVDAAQAAIGDASRRDTHRDPSGDSVWNPMRVATSVDVPDALLTIASEPGGEALADAAAAWSIADATGAPLAMVLERVSDAVQATVDVDREVAVEAAPARATARLMAFLPLIGILLGTTLGADPIRVLFGTGIGVGCLIVGLALACAGVWWIERLVKAVEA
jgi:tight adherence protein B